MRESVSEIPAPEFPKPSRLSLSPIWRELSGVLSLLSPSSTPPQPTRCEGPPVLLLPGFLAGDRSLSTLAGELSAAGLRPWFAGIERNVDCSEATMARLVPVLEVISGRSGQRVAIVGHSRGGLLGRVLARRRPDLVRTVVTLAAPYRAPFAVHPILLAHELALALAGTAGVPGVVRLSCGLGRCCARFGADLAAPTAAGVRYVAVYSRRDGIVDWRACADPSVDSVEVDVNHCGMADDPHTVNLVVSLLAAGGVSAEPCGASQALAA